jgi:nitrate/TMAO reductase-like tetraheme cytochrome c subunit
VYPDSLAAVNSNHLERFEEILGKIPTCHSCHSCHKEPPIYRKLPTAKRPNIPKVPIVPKRNRTIPLLLTRNMHLFHTSFYESAR